MAAGLECSEELELPEQDKEAFRSLCSHYSRACSLVVSASVSYRPTIGLFAK